MATNKAKRSIHLAQPQPQRQPQHAKSARPGDPATTTMRRSPNSETPEAMPVKASVYRTLAEFNIGFEQVIQSLGTLIGVRYLASESVRAMHNQLRRLRAQANCEFMTALNQREAANHGYFGSLGSLSGAPQTPPGTNPATPNAVS